MPNTSTAHEVLAVVFQVRHVTQQVRRATEQKTAAKRSVMERAQDPQKGAWSLPGGRLRTDEDMITRFGANWPRRSTCKSWHTSSSSRCSPSPTGCRAPGDRLDLPRLVPSPPPGAATGHPLASGDSLPRMAFDHGPMVTHAQARLAAKMSYTNIDFLGTKRIRALDAA